jgi:hypothetical protein
VAIGSFLKSNQRTSFKGLEKCRSEICDGVGSGSEKGSTIVGDALNAPVLANENAVEQLVDLSGGTSKSAILWAAEEVAEGASLHWVTATSKKSPPRPKV